MPKPAVLIPFGSTDPDRLANLATIQAWYAHAFPGVQQVVADDGGGRAGWTKAYAIQRAIDQTSADVFVVADSDCLCEATVPAALAVLAGTHQWAFPHTQIRRLTEAASAEVRAGAAPHLGMECEHPPYAGVAGGGIVVLTREAWATAPMDPRFKVTHGEDVAWARALAYLCGKPWYPNREKSPLYHLYHPPILAVGARYKANQKWAAEYSDATTRTIRDVIARGQAHVDPQPVEPVPSTATVAVIVPVLNRPAAAEPFMRSWADTNPVGSRVYAVTDAADTATRQAWETAGATVLTSDRGHTFAAKVNYAYEATVEPWLLLLGDDVRFHPGWLHAALKAGEVAPVVSTNDGARDDLDRLAVHPMMSRRYILERGASFDGPGLIAHEGYCHWYVDREWSFLAVERDALVYAPDCLIEHLHPIFGKGQMDDTYQRGQATARDDQRTYTLRESQYNTRIKRSARA